MNGKKVSWYKRIAGLIMEDKTFDVSQNEDGLKTVSQMIAKRMCDGLSWAQAVEAYPHYCNMVKKNLGHAILYLQEDLKIIVYRLLERKELSEDGKDIVKGGKFVEFLTIDVTYKNAKAAEMERIEILLGRSVSSTAKNLKLVAPKKDPAGFINKVTDKEIKKIIEENKTTEEETTEEETTEEKKIRKA